ncbi:MAG: ATP synthase F1 subunit gamma [Oscillospiraceae bacterium]|nr:ATP synthase F1 subunit gamma [Oscillospiraceae bacterium]
MANIREIRGRIKSVKSTQQITKAMKMVSAAKLHRIQGGMDAVKLFAERAREIVDALSGVDTDEPLLTPRQEVKTVCYVVFIGNRGLCSLYNFSLVDKLRELLASEEHSAVVVAAGRWGVDEMEDKGLPVIKRFSELSDLPTGDDAASLADYMKKLYLSGEADEIRLVYQQYHSAFRQTPVCVPFLPVQPTPGGEPPEYLIEPDRASVVHNALEIYVDAVVMDALREARQGEQAARMTDMSAATDATTELIDKLSLDLNRARQAAITAEIADIVGGTKAMKAGTIHT